jgi:hypothetical protein
VNYSVEDVERQMECRVTGTNAQTYTTLSSIFTEGAGILPSITCPALPAGVGLQRTEVVQTGGPADVSFYSADATTAYVGWRTNFPECATGSCLLDLKRFGDSCFSDAQWEACNGWLDDSARDSVYTCTYGTNSVSINECLIYAVSFDLASVLSGHGYANPLTGAQLSSATSPTIYDRVVKNLMSRDFVTTASFELVEDREEAAKVLASTCLAQVGISPAGIQQPGELPIIQLSEEMCLELAIFSPGLDVRKAAEHDIEAIAAGQPAVLHYKSQADKNSGAFPLPPGWYTRVAYKYECGALADGYLPGGATNCDEYPYYTTAEGGPGASLKNVRYDHNQLEGSMLGQFVDACGLNLGTSNGEYIVAPTIVLNSVGVCS